MYVYIYIVLLYSLYRCFTHLPRYKAAAVVSTTQSGNGLKRRYLCLRYFLL